MGTIEVITGGMYCGKSSELLRRVRHAIIAKQRVKVFKPKSDTRSKHLTTHDGQTIATIEIEHPNELCDWIDEIDVFAIEEVQFLDPSIVDMVEFLRNKGKRIIIAGLDMDYAGQVFHQMALLMGVADKVKKLNGICVVCGAPGTMSYRTVQSDDRIVIGANDIYECRCRKHWATNSSNSNFTLEYCSEWR